MDINNQFDKELLSAYLDDALTAAELAQVEHWLATDSAAVDYVSDLRNNRSSLKALASLGSSGLKPGLADRVLAEALSENKEQDNSVRLPSRTESSPSSKWWVWAALAAAAAVVLMLSLPVGEGQKPQPFAEVPVGPIEPLDVPEPNSNPVPGRDLPSRELVDKGSQSMEEMHQPNELIDLGMLLVGDVVMSPAAWEAARFDDVLQKRGIRYGKEIVASRQSIVDLLESQQMVGADPDPNSRVEAAIVYIQSTGPELNKLLFDIENEPASFVDYKYTMIMTGNGLTTPSTSNLLKSLREQAVNSPGQSLARMVLPERPDSSLGSLLPGYELSRRSTPKELMKGAADLVIRKNREGNVTVDKADILMIIRKQ